MSEINTSEMKFASVCLKKTSNEVAKFIVVGAANFLLTFAIFYLLLEIANCDYVISLVVASFVGMFFTYVLNYIWVFLPQEKVDYGNRLLKYIAAGCVSIFINAMLLKYLVESTDFDPFYLQITLIPAVVVFNFISAKFWSLKNFGIDG